MRAAHRPILSLFLCLALAVNLLAPLASASPLFVEICSGHRTILVPAQDAPDPPSCETCMVCCASIMPPHDWSSTPRVTCRVISRAVTDPASGHTLPMRANARAPPVLVV